jgi:8-oxo-dGTP pyrophosphatase MutT (NUDIX family)
MWVFPGGQVDPEDLPGHPAAGDEIAAARRAAVREAREEAGIGLEPDDLVVLSFWIPPPEAPRRFATWFFLAPFDEPSEVVVDRMEIKEHRWLTPRAAFDLRDEGTIELAPPTFMTLWWLAQQPDCRSALAAAAGASPHRYESHVAADRDRRFLVTMWAGDAGYDDGDIERPGPRRRLVMHPDGWRVEIHP